MDKRKAWREQEQQLVENWNAAAQRYREIMAQIATLRKKVARLKAEFNSGKRY